MKRSSGWIIPALALGTFSLLLYGYNENQIRTAAIANLQLQNVTAVHNLAYDIDEMQDALAKVLLTTQPQMTMTQLQSAARYAARADVDTLHMQGDARQMTDIQVFLNRIIAKADAMTAANLPGKLSSSDLSDIRSLTNTATVLEHHLRLTQATLLSDPMSVTSQGQASPLPKSAFISVGSSIASLSPVLRGVANNTKSHLINSTLAGNTISANKAINSARQYFHIPSSVTAQVNRFGPAYDDHGYMISFGAKENADDAMVVGVSLHGGKVLWMHRQSASGNAVIPPSKALHEATVFLQQHGLYRLALDQSDHYGVVSVYSFVPVVQGVHDTTRKVLVQVNRVNAQIVGFDASPYYLQNGTYVRTKALQEKATVLAGFRPAFKVESVSLAWKNFGTPAARSLCYEVLGRTSTNTFLVTVDANTGKQIAIDQLSKDEM